MTHTHINAACRRLLRTLSRFGNDTRGNIALIFGLSAVMIFTGVGAGLDLSRAYLARQKLSEVAALACQYASRPAIVDTSTASYNGTGGGATYSSQVTNFITATWQNQNISLTQTNGTPFTYTQGGAANVSLSASVPTTFMQIAGFTAVPIQAQAHCYDTPSSVQQRVPDSNSQDVIQESFETNTTGKAVTYYSPTGSAVGWPGPVISAPTGYNAAVGYTGAGGTQWHVEGYCLEQDIVGKNEATVFDGNYSVELDCDNGSGTKGNSSISTLVYAPAGTYELRYAYASRIGYPSYDPTYLCGSSATDLNWANSSSTSASGSMATAYRTNQINVYFDLNPASNQPPQHTTLDGTEQLAGSNLIDMCLYGQSWIQRSVTINVTTAGYYWLSFAADGGNDSYGGQLDDILFCRFSCSGSVQDNYTTAWAASSLLFEDTFESPSYSGSNYNTNGNVNNSDGSSSFWNVSGNGWSNAPINQLPYWVSGCPQSKQCVELGWYGGSNTSNSLISQSFLLVPGYYKIQYDYVSEVTFSSLSAVYCGSTPTAANISTLSAASSTGMDRVLGVNHGTLTHDTNTVGVFMSHAQLASTPNSGNALGSATSYTNPDGTTTTTPTVPPNGVSLTSYNASQSNPLIDICGYAATAQARTSYVFVEKPAYYWLTLAALGAADVFGGQIDDVRITSVGSPYMSSPPAGAVTLPVPSPQPGSTIAYTGFTIPADPLAP
ncbi:TadE/TadG family type IV pilus assembly protein [Bradyrhizobium sp.]|uniref:TadE/TadG family type IV pilus assembly protein n=1 Tax=Bradyrhizobium sp. TaxID=376 RepID=UPI003C1AF1D7